MSADAWFFIVCAALLAVLYALSFSLGLRARRKAIARGVDILAREKTPWIPGWFLWAMSCLWFLSGVLFGALLWWAIVAC